MKILYIAHRTPYPPNKGEKIRSFTEIKYLSREHDIYLACLADNFEDIKYVDDLKRYCKDVNVVPINPKLLKFKVLLNLFTNNPLSISYFYSKKLQRDIDQLLSINNFGAILCYSSPMAEYIFKSKFFFQDSMDYGNNLSINKHKPKTNYLPPKLIMDFVDVDSDKWLQYSKYMKFPNSWLYFLEAKRLAKYERRIAETFGYSIFVSTKEAKLFQKKNPHIGNVISISNGVDFAYYNLELVDGSQPIVHNTLHPKTSNGNYKSILLFIGTMDYFANIDGVKWFVKQVFPLIKTQIPDVKFYIVGSKPSKEVIALEKNNDVIVTGFVSDIREYLIRASVFVAPLRIARGIQNKILESMAMGIPVVATPQAFEGIEAEPNSDLFVESIPENFANQVVKLLNDHNIYEQLKNNARKIVEKKYSWDRNIKILNEIIKGPAIH